MASSNDWWNSFSPAIETIVGGVAAVFGKQLWNSFSAARNDEAKQDKADEQDRKSLLRDLDSRARTELERVYKRNNELEAEVLAERTSGMAHYHRCVRIYEYIVEMIHAWRNGRQPPDKVPDFDSF